MNRRDFITLLGGAAAWPLAARAQKREMPVVGWLSGRSAEVDAAVGSLFREGLAAQGYTEGRNLMIEYRWADGEIPRLPALAADLVNRRVSLIMAAGNPAVLAAKAATGTIPIVFSIGGDPVDQKLVTSLNRPGGNLTGVTSFQRDLVSKRIGLLHELVPKAARLALLTNPNDPTGQITEAESAARGIGLELLVLRVQTDRDIETAFATMAERKVGALLRSADSFLVSRRNQIVSSASRYALPTMYTGRDDVVAGGLIGYGSDGTDGYQKAGVYAGRILNGTKPADLPIQQPTKFQLVINLKTAKALGLDVPPTLIAIADEVIE
jgi:putative ABC transport system substrate-binding protein